MDFSLATVAEQKRRLDRWYRITDGVNASAVVPQSVIEALSDDLNTPKAIAALDALATKETAADLKAGAQFMGLLMQNTSAWFRGDAPDGITVEEIEDLIQARADAKSAKNFEESDRIRDRLQINGVILEDGPAGTTWRKAD